MSNILSIKNWVKNLLLLFALHYSMNIFSQETFIPYLKGHKWGFANTNGEIIIQPQFDSVSRNTHPYEIYLNGKMGIINMKGEYIIKPIYDYIYYNRGYSKEEPYYVVSKNSFVGVIDSNETIIIPFKYKIPSIYTINMYKKEDGITCFYSTQGKKFRFDKNYQLLKEEPKEDNSVRVLEGEKETNFPNLQLFKVQNKYGVEFDKRVYYEYSDKPKYNKIIVKPEYDSINLSDTTKKIMYVKKGNKWGCIDENNRIIVPIEYEAIASIYTKANYFVKLNGKWGAIEVNNGNVKELLAIKYDSLYKSHDNWNFNFIAQKNEQRFYIFRYNSSLEIPLYNYKTMYINTFNGFEVVQIVTKSGHIAYLGKNGVYFFEEE